MVANREPDALLDLADNVRDLAEHYRHEERRPHTWSPARHRVEQPPWVTWHAPLLVQLYQVAQSAMGGEFVGGRARSGQSSGPAGLFALAQLDVIRRGVARWYGRLELTSRGDLIADLRGLVGAAASADHSTGQRLAADVARWRLSCLTLTGWRTSYRPPAPCPHCDRMPGTVDGKPVGLRVRLDKSTARCMTEDCGAHWSQATIGVLAEHVRSYRDSAPTEET